MPGILIIDHDKDERTQLVSYLHDNDWHTVTTDSGRQGLELFDQIQPDMVLLDLSLEDVSLDLIVILAEKNPFAGLIVLADRADSDAIIECMASGAWNYLIRPLDNLSLLGYAVGKARRRTNHMRNQLMAWNEKDLQDEDETTPGAPVTQDEEPCSQVEQSLIESERKLRTLIANLPGMVYRCANDPDWTMEFLSEGCFELTGYPIEELLGAQQPTYASIILPEDQDPVWEQVQVALEKQIPFRLTYRIRSCDNKIKWVWEQGRGVHDAAGELLALEGFIVDITDRVRAEEALKQANNLMERRVCERTAELSSRNRELQLEVDERKAMEGELRIRKEISNAVIHNIANVMNSVEISSQSMIQIIRTSRLDALGKVASRLDEQGESLASYLTEDPKGQLIPTYLSRLSSILQKEHKQLLDEIYELKKRIRLISEATSSQQSFARESLHDKDIRLCHLIEESLKIQLVGGMGPSIQVKKHLSEVGFVNVPRAKIAHIFLNIIKNACEALAENDRDNRILEILLQEEGEDILVHFRDNGCGISTNDMGHMFRYGFTTKSEGHGFGLHYCRRVMNELGGSLEVASKGPGQGTTFTVHFPAAVRTATPSV